MKMFDFCGIFALCNAYSCLSDKTLDSHTKRNGKQGIVS